MVDETTGRNATTTAAGPEMICTKHKTKLECLGGCNAHSSNWYCQKCEVVKQTLVAIANLVDDENIIEMIEFCIKNLDECDGVIKIKRNPDHRLTIEETRHIMNGTAIVVST